MIVDANLLPLLVAGSCDPRQIESHKNLSGYDETDFQVLGSVLTLFSDTILLPHLTAR